MSGQAGRGCGAPSTRRSRSATCNYASFTRHHLVTHLLACGDPLAEVQREAEAGLDFARRAQVDLAVDRISGQLQLIRTLRGLTAKFGCFDDAGFNEEQFEHRLEADPHLVQAAFWYWVRKLQARVLADDPAAIAAAAKANRLLWTSKALFDRVEFHFYAALAQAATRRVRIRRGSTRLEAWRPTTASFSSGPTSARRTLLTAPRSSGRRSRASKVASSMPCVSTIGPSRSARANGFVQNEAVANELAGRFYAVRGFEKIAYAYLRDAHYGYLRWGADAKVRQLERLYPRLHVAEDGGAAGNAEHSSKWMSPPW